MSITNRISLLRSNPGMLGEYIGWLVTRFSGRKPIRKLKCKNGDIYFREWITFSEYWMFRDLIPSNEIAFMEQVLHKNDKPSVAFDIGANIGTFSCWMASLGNEVHSFEPIPTTFCRLQSNLAFNRPTGVSHLNCCGIGAETGLVSFEIQTKAPAKNRIATANAKETQSIAIFSLDDYCESKGVEYIDFAKVDVEGMEPLVLRGARNLLNQKQIGVMLLEVCPWNLEHAGMSVEILYAEICECDYEPFTLSDDGSVGQILSFDELKTMELENIVLLPKK